MPRWLRRTGYALLGIAALGAWDEADFFRSLREDRRPDGTAIDPEKMPWVRSGQMTDAEIRAVWTYVRSLPGRPEEDVGSPGS
ncbi:MAG TPA: hypothetical protein VMN37_09855 [Gemmatimonadales bacterium]|nr:hypothetical protein [Gemmatimonadales bacterium]